MSVMIDPGSDHDFVLDSHSAAVVAANGPDHDYDPDPQIGDNVAADIS